MTSEKDYMIAVEADNVAYRALLGGRDRTKGLTPPSGVEVLLLWGVLFVVSALFYFHLEFRPILPIELAPGTAEIVKLLAFVGLGVSVLAMMTWVLSLLYVAFDVYVRRAILGPCVICARCGACTSVDKYAEIAGNRVIVHGCKKCGSFRVYCLKCGKSAHVGEFLSGEGCPHCGYPDFMIKYP